MRGSFVLVEYWSSSSGSIGQKWRIIGIGTGDVLVEQLEGTQKWGIIGIGIGGVLEQ